MIMMMTISFVAMPMMMMTMTMIVAVITVVETVVPPVTVPMIGGAWDDWHMPQMYASTHRPSPGTGM